MGICREGDGHCDISAADGCGVCPSLSFYILFVEFGSILGALAVVVCVEGETLFKSSGILILL
jgi:hypothetical protein